MGGMIRHVRLVFVACLLATPAQADPQWTRLPTVPYTLNNKQDAIVFADAQRGWYGNGTGRVYRTDDAGAHWRQIWENPGTYIRALDFADGDLGFLGNVGPGYFPNVRDTEPLYVSRDGGEHWSPVKPQQGEPIKGVCAIDILKVDGKVAAIRAGGRVGGPAAMMESFDEGKTWRSRDMRGVTGMILDIKFVDAQTGFIAGASESGEDKAHARILKTSDGGNSWRAVFESPRAGDNNWKLSFPSPQVGYATIMSYLAPDDEARGYVVKTTDGGEHWQKSVVTRDRDWIPYGIAFVDEQHGLVGGSTGGYETRDGGQSWTAVAMGLSVNRIRFVTRPDGGKTAYAIGHDLYRLDLPAPQ
jgi:photosystem II stability/assembly factor-like uncharacterized protein